MGIVWLATSFNYYLIQFLINTFEQVYWTAIFSSISEIMGYFTGACLLNKLGVRASLSVSFGLAFIGATLLLFYGLDHQESNLFPVLVLIAKFGIASAFNIIFISHTQIFPVLFSATAFGICNFTSRIFTGVSPVLAQIEEPTPLMVFLMTSLLALIVVWGVQVEKQERKSKGSKNSDENSEAYVKPMDTS